MKTKYKRLLLIIIFALTAVSNIQAQKEKVKNRPNADQKLYSFGFTVGLNAQDIILSHSGYMQPNGEVWFAEIPSYTPGFNVGIIADRYLSQYLNLRIVPSLYFGDKEFIFREQTTGEEYRANVKTNYVSFPLLMKFSAKRVNNYRPYVLGGIYGNMEIGSRKDQVIKLNSSDFGLQFGIGCNFYMPLFKLCPELRFSFGLKDIINKDRSDLLDKDLIKYTEAFSSGKARMVTLTFNFE